MRRFALLAVVAAWFGVLGHSLASAEATMSCPAGTYDMLDWMTLDSNLRASYHMTGSANPLYTQIQPGKFSWVKGGNGYPWDIQLYDNQYIYQWITEYSWNSPTTYKKFTNNTNMPFAPRCAKGGFPGSTIKVPNTSYDIHTSCQSYTTHTLKMGINQLWGPYKISLGGNLPGNLPTLILSYRYNCDVSYGNCGDKEEFYFAQRYGLVQWVHYALISGKYQQQQKSVFNQVTSGTAVTNFSCF